MTAPAPEITSALPRAVSPDPTVFVLFGATGDLAHRMVLPAFYQLAQHGLMPTDWMLIGNGRGDVSHEDFRGRVADSLTAQKISLDDKLWTDFSSRLRFAGGGFGPDDPGTLLDVLKEAHDQLGSGARYIHYLAVPPVAFGDLAQGLAQHNLLDGARVVFEKPYGTSLVSFQQLDDLVHSVMKEDQVYRIDHFLGKEGTQNLHVLRFVNTMFGGVWNADHVAQVQLDAPEKLDVADRAEFYDATGAFRDMIASHLFQVAAEVAMEPPTSLAADDLQTARESVIASFRPLDPAQVVFGQADGYRELPDVPDDSTTETYAAVTLWIDTDRWRGVPFYLRSGKYLSTAEQRVTLVLKDQKDGPLPSTPGHGGQISVSLEGDGAISLILGLKEPGPGLSVAEQRIDFSLDSVAGGEPLPPYVALLHDVTIGDRSLFTSSEGLAKAWAVAQPVFDHRPPAQPYAVGSSGPAAGDALPGPAGWLTGPSSTSNTPS